MKEMFLSIEEMKSVLYEYQMDEIAEGDQEIITDGILAAVAEVRAYFEAANARRQTAGLNAQQFASWKVYDCDAIFSATGDKRNQFVVRLCKRVAAYNICELANVDVIYDHVRQRYEQTVVTLEKIAGMGDYATSRLVISELPSPDSSSESGERGKPFRMISRPKFHHE